MSLTAESRGALQLRKRSYQGNQALQRIHCFRRNGPSKRENDATQHHKRQRVPAYSSAFRKKADHSFVVAYAFLRRLLPAAPQTFSNVQRRPPERIRVTSGVLDQLAVSDAKPVTR